MSTLVRRTPLRRKRPTPRRRGAVCSVRTCHRPPRVLGLCYSHAVARADDVFKAFIKARDGGCVVAHGTHSSGPLHWSHLISRSYHATRWDPDASVAMCAAHHVYFTHHPLELDEWANFWLGPTAFEKLKRKALDGARPDLEHIIEFYGRPA